MLYKRKNLTAVAMCAVVSATSLCFGLAGCSRTPQLPYYDPDTFGEFANDFMLLMMGSDASTWNTLSVTPEQSYGYERYGDPSWYSYSPLTKNDASTVNYIFGLYKSEMNRYNFADLSAADQVAYRTMQNVLADYTALYGSKYAVEFNLIGGSYISAEGGYVSDFATIAECYAFRNENDVEDLLQITVSTKDAFESYLDFARDRKRAGYPLYDYTVRSMQEYLDEVSEQGQNYYLYGFVDKKIDDASFLTTYQKQDYKEKYAVALTDYFMNGVKTLSQGLNDYIGNVTVTEKSYLASYGAMGREYYKWLFSNKTGMRNVDLDDVFDELVLAMSDAANKMEAVERSAAALEASNKTAFDDFNAYADGEKSVIGAASSQEILDYLKVAAKDIVPDLDTIPQIDFKYMDETVAGRTSTLAYYLLSPIDEKNSVEHITINPVTAMKDPNELLMTMAHEGYPGHLYAHVYSKENDTDFLPVVMGSSAFSEGWAVYVEYALMDSIAAKTDDIAVRLFCDYKKYECLSGYYNTVIVDLMVNYYGKSVADLTMMGNDEAVSRRQVEILMEMPAAYVPYGYGTYSIVSAHEKAKAELGAAYSETEFNGILLSEGKASLPRVDQITSD
ncbi:MAG: DUF885 domain-containing protein, partial [Clostridiales bacterium]|nr:DUF885 domain-containing protein [Clostridiales bacterium]